MHVPDEQRRARLVHRHHLARTADDAVSAVRGIVAMHASDPLTPFLGVRARLRNSAGAIEDLETALYEERSLWRLHAIRRTLFVAELGDARLLEAAAGRDVARKERRRLRGWLAPEIGEHRVDGWLRQVEAKVLEALADGQPRETTRLASEVPELTTEVTLGAGRWTQRGPISSRLLFLMAMEGSIVRGRPLGSWRSSQFRWVTATAWFADPPAPLEDEAEARAGLLRRYLAANGPATRTDVRWWTGWTVKQTTAALDEVGAIIVGLDRAENGYMLPDDLDTLEPQARHVSLLPALDPTTMGWKDRDWYLGAHADRLFDSNGNAGPTVWLDGRVVGGWAVRSDGEVVHRELEDVGSEGHARIAGEAAELGAWLAGIGVVPRFRSPMERELTA